MSERLNAGGKGGDIFGSASGSTSWLAIEVNARIGGGDGGTSGSRTGWMPTASMVEKEREGRIGDTKCFGVDGGIGNLDSFSSMSGSCWAPKSL
jgi:hypothetical protein